MDAPIRLLIHGAHGRMGQALQRLCRGEGGCEVAAAVSRSVGPRVVDGVPQFAASELAGAPEFDVAIDFSLPEAFDAILATCLRRRRPLVSGTTGLSPAQISSMDAAAVDIPLAWASNFSLGVAVLHELVERAARALPGWECDIVEAHHARKLDAPSGTALTLGVAAAEGGASARHASIRAGDIVGEHLVQFTGIGERIELIHRASSRDIFARGALHAARALNGRAPGRYRVRDLL
jgi:4-hydroxy-tetrahydrodipicolinate reductase